jgi:iron complex outermembrane recepter protein
MSSSNQISRAVRRALVLSAVAMAGNLPAIAQQQLAAAAGNSEESVETVTVTGSRIPQPQIESISPLTTISNEQIQQTGVTRVEDLLNTLPQVAGQYGAGVSNGATGEATVSLRNLGANRTLVLVNGRRLMPGDPTQNGNAAPDLNQIPSALVERVDLLTGGASAVYGADAVAGVVNFVMNDHFEGVRLEGNYSFYNHSNKNGTARTAINNYNSQANHPIQFSYPTDSVNDGYTRDFSLIAGANFADGKGNATAYFGYRRVDPVLQAKRDFSSCSLTSSGSSGTGSLTCGGSSTAYPARFNYTKPGTNPATGKPFKAVDQHLDPGTGDLSAGHLFYNFAPLNYFQRPDERYTAGAFLHYDINDHARFYSEFMFMDDRTIAQIAPSGAFYGSGTAVTASGVPDGSWVINCNNPYLTPGELTSWCGGNTAAPDAHVLIGRRNIEGGNRRDDLGHTSYRAVAGLKGDLTDAWTYDVYALWGTTRLSEEYLNDVSKFRTGNALQAVVDPVTGQTVCRANASGGNGAPGCVPYNIFTLAGPSQEALNYISVPGISKGATTERVVDGAVTGDLGKYGIQMPTAHDGLGVSGGFEYREEKSELFPDIEFQTNDLAGQGAPTLPTVGSFHVWEGFTEIRAPIAQDLPFAKSVVVDAGYRYSKYNLEFGSTNTYKFGVQWAPIADVRLRLDYNRAVRSPNIQELFLQPRVQNDGTADPCTGAAPIATAAQCAFSGVTAAEYGTIAANPAAQYNGQAGGNIHLSPEKADTYTAGIVFTPTFLPDFNMTIDYYNITIKNFITTYGANLIVNQCVNTGDPFYCNKVHRTQGTGTAADGSLWISTSGYIDDGTFNLGAQRTDGIDLTSAYRLNLAGLGRLNFDFVGTYVTKAETRPVVGGDDYDCKGLYGPVCGVPAPRWKHKFRTTWNTPLNGLDAFISWRHVSGLELETISQYPLLQGGWVEPGTHLGHRDYIDLGGSYTLASKYTVRAGVNNLFDKDPPLSTSGNLPTVFGNGNTLPTVYDALGRYIFINVTVDL